MLRHKALSKELNVIKTVPKNPELSSEQTMGISVGMCISMIVISVLLAVFIFSKVRVIFNYIDKITITERVLKQLKRLQHSFNIHDLP